MADQLSLVLLVVPLVCLIFGTIHLDVSAMMGYTGALMKGMLGTATGISSAAGILVLWAVLPVMLSLRIFRKKDL